jgi:anti-anti-sigma factor
MNLRLAFRPVGNVIAVYCKGKITFGEAATLLSNPIATLLANRRQVLLHLGGVEAMDAAGLGTLAELAALARTSGGEIKFSNPPGHIASLLDLTRLSQILEVYETEEEALAAWGEGSAEPSSGFPTVA